MRALPLQNRRNTPLHFYGVGTRASASRWIASGPSRLIQEGVHRKRNATLRIASQAQATETDARLSDAGLTSTPDYCSGCGVKLQNQDKDAPGFFVVPKSVLEPKLPKVKGVEAEDEVPADQVEETPRSRDSLNEASGEASTSGRGSKEGAGTEGEADAAFAYLNSLFDDDMWEGGKQKRRAKPASFEEEDDDEEEEDRILCARCYSLQHYGKVKSQKAEALLPAFDLGKKVGRKMALQKFRRPVVLCVVDLADFDGSLPRHALLSLLPQSMLQGDGRRQGSGAMGWNTDREAGLQDCRLVVACNKADLLPSQASPVRLEAWIRRRIGQAGLPRPDSIHLISSTKQFGVKGLLTQLQKDAGVSGDVWVVGAQNAGKSSLINAMRRTTSEKARKSSKKDITTAPLPGTTLGMLRIDGIMQGRCRMFDTPGVPHEHQLSSRLTPDEVRLLLPRGRLTPRTFRASVGQTVFVGGLARVDVLGCSGATLYLTVWASSDIPCHYGKVDGAEERYAKMAGNALIPPLGDAERVARLGPLLPSELLVEGTTWKASSMDVAVAGLGWIGVGLSGSAKLAVWTHQGVSVTVREALIPDMALELEKLGLGNKTQKPPRVVKKAKK